MIQGKIEGSPSRNHASATPQGNNFDAIRLIAALAVLVSHAFPLTYGSDAREPMFQITNGQTTIGTIAVAVFFTISGFLITRSLILGGTSAPGIVRFVRARALRIMPGFVTVLVLLTFFFGPIATTLPATDYFHSHQLLTFLSNGALVTFRDGLPAVFARNPFADSVDGSLWTLRYEVRCYLLVLALGVVGLLRSSVIAALFVLCLWLSPSSLAAFLFASFLGGAIIYLYRPPIDDRIAAGCACALLISPRIGAFALAAPVFGSYFVIWLATSKTVRLPRLAKYGDFSYGVYIYAFPVQQAITQLMGGAATWYWNIIASTPVVLVLAVLSWITVERPALALKRSAASG